MLHLSSTYKHEASGLTFEVTQCDSAFEIDGTGELIDNTKLPKQRLTINSIHPSGKFDFTKSTPETVEKVARGMLEIVEFVKGLKEFI